MAAAAVMARDPAGQISLIAATGLSVDQPFRVASISKMIAAAGFLPLAMREGLDLDADVSPLLGFSLRHPLWPETPITARMLLSHTSGLRNGSSYPVPLGHTLAEAFQPGARHYDAGGWFGPAAHGPGTWFAYADVNFALIAQLIERLSGLRFDLYMRRALFEPLGLDIGYNWSGVSVAKRAKAAPGLRWINGRWTAQVDAVVPPYPLTTLSHAPQTPDLKVEDYRPGDNGFLFSPQGGLRLSLSDMDRLAQVFAEGGRSHGKSVLPASALQMMQTRAWTLDLAASNGDTDEGVFQSYGLGVQTPTGRPGPGGDAFFGPDTANWRGHLGDAYGWMTGLFWNIKDRRTLVWAVNGMPETGRPPGLRSSLTAPEEALVDRALAALG